MSDLLNRLLYWHIPTALWWVVGPFLAWRVGLRIYRLVARQKFSKKRSRIRAASLGALTLFIGVVAFEERTAFFSLCGGLALGAILGAAAVKLTSLRLRRNTTSIQPDLPTGVVLSVLLLSRIAWRLVEGSADGALGWTLAEFVRNSSTMVLFGLFSAHYFVYSLGIVGAVRRKRAQ
jgi:hypothetical protein